MPEIVQHIHHTDCGMLTFTDGALKGQILNEDIEKWQRPRNTSAPNDMKISAWKDFAELVALMAVVGGLVAVVIELRQTQSALRAQAYQTRALDVINTMHAISANPERAILMSDYLGGDLTVDTASPEELSQLRSHFYMRRTDLDNEHYQYQNGFLDADFYETTTKREIKAYAPHWRAFGIPEPRQKFTEEVERILADPAVKSALE